MRALHHSVHSLQPCLALHSPRQCPHLLANVVGKFRCSSCLLGTNAEVQCQQNSPDGCRAIKFKEDLDPELKAKLERRPLAAQPLFAASDASRPQLTSGSQPTLAGPQKLQRRTAEVLVLQYCNIMLSCQVFSALRPAQQLLQSFATWLIRVSTLCMQGGHASQAPCVKFLSVITLYRDQRGLPDFLTRACLRAGATPRPQACPSAALQQRRP